LALLSLLAALQAASDLHAKLAKEIFGNSDICHGMGTATGAQATRAAGSIARTTCLQGNIMDMNGEQCKYHLQPCMTQ